MVSYFLSEDKRSPTAGGYAIAVGDFVTGGERSLSPQLLRCLNSSKGVAELRYD